MLSDNDLKKISKELGKEFLEDLNKLPVQELKTEVVKAAHAIKTAVAELEANPKYQELKESLGDLKAGLTSLRKRQSAITQYVLHLLEDKVGQNK